MKKILFVSFFLLISICCFAETTRYYESAGMVRDGRMYNNSSYKQGSYLTFSDDYSQVYESDADGNFLPQSFGFTPPDFTKTPKIISYDILYFEEQRSDGVLVYKNHPVGNSYGWPVITTTLFVSKDFSRLNVPFSIESGTPGDYDYSVMTGTFIYEQTTPPKKQRKEDVPFY